MTVPPNLLNAPSRFHGDGEYAGLYLVPLADVRILVLGKNPDGSLLVVSASERRLVVSVRAALALFGTRSPVQPWG